MLRTAPLSLALLLLSSTATATPLFAHDTVRIQLSGVSKHFVDSSEAHDYNEIHPGLGVEWGRVSPSGRWATKAALGVMEDSYEQASLYAMLSRQYRLPIGQRWTLESGVAAGAMYKAVDPEQTMRLLPVVAPMLTIQTGGYGLNLLIVPPVSIAEYDSPLITYFQLTLPLK